MARQLYIVALSQNALRREREWSTSPNCVASSCPAEKNEKPTVGTERTEKRSMGSVLKEAASSRLEPILALGLAELDPHAAQTCTSGAIGRGRGSRSQNEERVRVGGVQSFAAPAVCKRSASAPPRRKPMWASVISTLLPKKSAATNNQALDKAGHAYYVAFSIAWRFRLFFELLDGPAVVAVAKEKTVGGPAVVW